MPSGNAARARLLLAAPSGARRRAQRSADRRGRPSCPDHVRDDGIAEGPIRCLDDEAWHRAPEMMRALLQPVAPLRDVSAVPSGNAGCSVSLGSAVSAVFIGSAVSAVPSGNAGCSVSLGSAVSAVFIGSAVSAVPSGNAGCSVFLGSAVCAAALGSAVCAVPSGSAVSAGVSWQCRQCAGASRQCRRCGTSR
ncbi:hypothetical protein DZF91_14455 [Actinomadura logoneensis]|uniref:Uncharacterized protein n=1 Tax=Actinomadura logoneensis TaxID=2293572 RepID=A0A372JLQ9_9ACTN|nr:hypothetical protein DZF91_14455 [Actinomadura logoneensis]